MRNLWIALGVACLATGATLAAESNARRPLAWTSLEDMHADYVQAFVHSDGFGIRRVTPMMLLMQDGSLILDGQRLRVDDVQMIGIAKHDPPVVFPGGLLKFQHGDEPDAFRPDAAQRPVSAQELRVLERLRHGEEVMSLPLASGPGMIGAIRATDDCLRCHQSKQAGDMLGAFVYTLEPVRQ